MRSTATHARRRFTPLWLFIALASRAALAATCDVVQVCGARADNATNAGPALTACAAAGGPCSAPNSALVFPANAHFLSGSIDLSNTVNLTLSFSPGAAIYGSGDPSLFALQPALPPTNMPQFAQQWAALIYARNVTGLTLEGPQSAVVDGLGWPWWRAFANGSLAHQRPKLVEVVDGQRVTFRGLTFRNSPFWTLHTLYSRNVQFLGVTITAPRNVGNTDGIDPDSCSDVLIEDCVIDVGDDGISLKSDFRVDPHTGDVTLLPTERVVS
jgi:polygalacturonase